MKKRILSFVLALAILFAGMVPIDVQATEAQNTEKITVYNGAGEFVGEFDSYEEFETEILGINEETRGIVDGLRWIIKIILTAINAYSTVETVSDITGRDIHALIGDKILLPAWNGVKQHFKLMSVSGGITNPYPLNSYQYNQFYKTNFYWVEY